jgi:hypothetical protein
MRLAVHVSRLLWESVRFGFATRRFSVIAVVAIGLLLVALTLTAQTVAPLALYPFA